MFADGTDNAVKYTSYTWDAGAIRTTVAWSETTTATGTVSLAGSLGDRQLRRLKAGNNVTLDVTTDPNVITITSSDTGATDLDGLTDAVSSLTKLQMGMLTDNPPTLVTGDVCIGPDAGRKLVSATGGNTILGQATFQNKTNAANNVVVGRNIATQGDGYTPLRNVLIGHDVASYLRDGTDNVAIGHGAMKGSTTDGITGTNNVCIGSGTGGTLSSGGNNVLVGAGIGVLTTGSRNTIVGNFTVPSASFSHTVVLADGSGNVRALWKDNAGTATTMAATTFSSSGIFSIGSTAVSLDKADTVTVYYDTSETATVSPKERLIFVYRDTASTNNTHTLELTNERLIGADITTTTFSLSAAQRNRFTRVSSTSGAVTITVVAYTGIITGAEHEFMNSHASNNLTFAAGTGVTIQSLDSKLIVPSYGVAVLKYLGSSTFLLCGAII